jgi:hypothetical protein
VRIAGVVFRPPHHWHASQHNSLHTPVSSFAAPAAEWHMASSGTAPLPVDPEPWGGGESARVRVNYYRKRGPNVQRNQRGKVPLTLRKLTIAAGADVAMSGRRVLRCRAAEAS